MRRINYFFLALAFSSCAYDDLFPTIKGYETSWEYDLREYYPSPWTPPPSVDYLQVYKIIKSENGSFIVVARNGTPPYFGEGFILTKLSASGSVIKDVKIKTPYGIVSNTTINGNILLYHGDTLTTYNSELSLVSNLVMSFGNEFHELRTIEGTNIFMTLYKNSKPVLVDYDQAGKELWEIPFASLGCMCSTFLNLCLNHNNVAVVSVPVESDTVKVFYVHAADGTPIWNRRFLRSSTHLEGYSVTPVWTANILTMISQANNGKDIRVISLDDEIETKVLKAGLPEGSVIQKAIVSKDGGILIGISTNNSVDVANFRLIKVNRIKKIEWEGAFYQLGVDSLSDIVELENGLVITVTGKGYITALSPSY